MNLKIIEIILIVILLVLGMETILKIKNSEGKLIKDVRKFLLVRIDIIIVLTIVISILTIVNVFNKKPNTPRKTPKPSFNTPTVYTDANFNIRLIKTVNSSVKSNYLISPYSIEMALNLLKEGAKDNTYDEINNLVNRKINDVSNEKVKVANAMFVKNKFKNYIEKSFYDNLKAKYNSEILYDDFNTPKLINNWVNEHTDKMIPKILDTIDKDFVLGLANAIAIDVDWTNSFECIGTRSEEFTKIDGSNVNVEMMHQTYKHHDAKYFNFDSIKGIILPYKNNLEFVGIIPDNINNYINSLNAESFDNIDKNAINSSDKLHIVLSLPRFSYSFDLNNFKNILIAMGINDVFDPVKSNLTNIITNDNLVKVDPNYDNIYVDEAIHKTYIDLNEKGTKAAAVTYFGIKANATAMEEKYETVQIEFNKPFVYMIRDIKNKEILFFGVVYEPNIWNGSTCSNQK